MALPPHKGFYNDIKFEDLFEDLKTFDLEGDKFALINPSYCRGSNYSDSMYFVDVIRFSDFNVQTCKQVKDGIIMIKTNKGNRKVKLPSIKLMKLHQVLES